MRTLYLFLFLALLSGGCLYGAARTSSSTTYTYDASEDKNHVVATMTTTGSGQQVGASVPFMAGGGYASPNGMIYGQHGYGGGSAFCAMYPGQCVSNVTFVVPQPNVVMTNGGYPGDHGARPSNDAPAETVDIAELQARLHDVESKMTDVDAGLTESLRLHCQMILDHPEMVNDETQRAQLVQSCTDALK